MPLADRFDKQRGWLLPGRHVAPLHEIHSLFVDEAPHAAAREGLFEGLVGWLSSVSAVVDADRFWVDGGFVTHKSQAPSDIDVVAFVRADRLTPAVEKQLSPLVTQQIGGLKVKPMGGRVDAFVVESSLVNKQYWLGWWTQVRIPDTGDTWIGARKGFVEVTT